MNMCQTLIHILLVGWYIINLLIMMNIEIMLKCHMSPYNWPSQMNMCQNPIHILLKGQNIINIDEYWNKVQMPHVTMGNPCRII